MKVWLNGQFFERDDAQVSVFDAGFQHGVGLFETLGAKRGRAFRAEAHMQRLAGSARDLQLTERLRTGPLVEAIHLAIRENDLDDARVRLTLTGGNLSTLQQTGESAVDPTILIVAQPPTPYPDEFFEKGVVVAIADARLNPFEPMAGHKTLNYWPRIFMLQQAGVRGAAESIWFTVSNHLACGSVSNVFLVEDDVLYTPIARGEEESGAIPSAVLPGITRAAILELAEEMGVAATRQMLEINDLLKADEVFLTNSSWGVLPVIGVERETIGGGAVGEMTQRLRAAWLDLVDRETAPADAV
jgi:branched-subunit amino acid aminotransferase/4-amino-4-deoxychorismate lyase